MYRIDPQKHRERYGLQPDEAVPDVGMWQFKELQEESKVEEQCFFNTVSCFFLDWITLEEYFDRLIAHLEIGATLHTFDTASSTKIPDVLTMDLIAGAVKSMMLSQSLPRLSAEGMLSGKDPCCLPDSPRLARNSLAS